MKNVTKQESRAYDVRAEGEWARVYITEGDGSGSIAIISTFGNFSNFWGSIGPKPLRHWLQTTDFHYFMNKTSNNHGRRFDSDKLIDDLVKIILRARREQSLDRETAREYYDEIKSDLCDIASIGHFWSAAPEWLPAFIDYDPPSGEIECPQCRGFWDMLWPHILDAWKAEMDVDHNA